MSQPVTPFLTEIAPARTDNLGVSGTVSVQGIYDTNIFRTNSDLQRSVDDVILQPRLQADYRRLIGPHDVRIGIDVAYSAYTGNSSRSRERLSADGAATVRVAGACQIEPRARALRQQADYGDINGAVDNLQVFGQEGVKASCPRSAGFYPFGEIVRDTTRNDDAFDFADQTSISYSAGVGYNRPSLGGLSVYYNHVRSKRPSLDIITRVDRAGATFSRAIVSRFSLSADIHYLEATSTGAVVRPYKGPGWNIDLRSQPVPALTLTARSTRRILNDSLVPSGFAVLSEYTLQSDVRLNDRIEARAQAILGRRKFRRDPSVIASPLGADKYRVFVGSVSRRFGERLAVNFEVRRLTRSTDAGLSEYRATLFTAGVGYRFRAF